MEALEAEPQTPDGYCHDPAQMNLNEPDEGENGSEARTGE